MPNHLAIQVHTITADRRGNPVDVAMATEKGQIGYEDLFLSYQIEYPEAAPISVRIVQGQGIAVGSVLFYSGATGHYCIKLADGGFSQGDMNDSPTVELSSRFAIEQNGEILWCYQTSNYQISHYQISHDQISHS